MCLTFADQGEGQPVKGNDVKEVARGARGPPIRSCARVCCDHLPNQAACCRQQMKQT
jgi:hypothetical protein